MLELFPAGFEERDHADGLELVAYTDDAGEERLWAAFGEVTAVDVPSGWEERWREFHRPVQIGPLWVGPPWETPPADGETVVVDPGRAFGTGGHATTRLCLELLAELEPGSLVDAGCGSGVLAIAAARLGFAPVTALDHDAQALAATARNAAANRVSVECRLADVLAGPLPPAGAVVANISAEAIERLVPHAETDVVVASGYLEQDGPVPEGFTPERRLTQGGWAADLLRRSVE